MKPMLASDAVLEKVRYPCFIQPKVDGVRGMNMLGKLTGRSLKAHKNKYTTAFYSNSAFLGMDGELAAEHECNPNLCRITSSALSTIEGEPYTLWWVFDYLAPHVAKHPYHARFTALAARIAELQVSHPHLYSRLRLIPNVYCENEEQLLAQKAIWLEMGYEGVIIRDINGMHKQGRSTVREMGLLRIKDFIETEAIVVGITEGQTNLNEAQINELGKTFRTSHADGKVPNGMLGSIQGKLLVDVYDLNNPTVRILEAGSIVTISPGSLTEVECKYFWENQGQIIGRVSKFKFFPKGIKDKPRFPNHQSFRMESDL